MLIYKILSIKKQNTKHKNKRVLNVIKKSIRNSKIYVERKAFVFFFNNGKQSGMKFT